MRLLKSAWTLGKATIDEFMEDNVLRLSAAMAYYAIFSIGPLLILIVGLAGVIMGEDRVRQEVAQQLQSLLGENSAKVVQSMMASRHHGQSLWATIVGGVALVLGAAGVFGQLQDALNTIWEVKPKPGTGIWGFIRTRFLSMTMVLGIGFLLLISMVLTTCANAFAGYLGELVSLPGWVVPAFNELVSLLVITVLFALIFKVLPDVKLRMRDVLLGAIGTALLFTVGKFLLGLYLAQQSTASPYGAGTAFVLILLYVYYSSLILFLGAEFTQVYVRRKTGIEPTKYAVRVTDEQRAQEGIPRQGTLREKAGRQLAANESPSEPEYASEFHQTDLGGIMQKSKIERTVHRSHRLAPIEQVQAQAWSFVGLALATGMAAGLLLKFKNLRKALKVYAELKK